MMTRLAMTLLVIAFVADAAQKSESDLPEVPGLGCKGGGRGTTLARAFVLFFFAALTNPNVPAVRRRDENPS